MPQEMLNMVIPALFFAAKKYYEDEKAQREYMHETRKDSKELLEVTNWDAAEYLVNKTPSTSHRTVFAELAHLHPVLFRHLVAKQTTYLELERIQEMMENRGNIEEQQEEHEREMEDKELDAKVRCVCVFW